MSDVRVAFALVPGEPHFSAVVRASQEITKVMGNRNIIDPARFPPHVSLHICTVDRARLAAMFAHLQATRPEGGLAVPLRPARLYEGTSGYITFELARTEPVTALHEWVLQAAAIGRGHPSEPDTATPAERYGGVWIRDRFTPHYSIAKVDPADQPAALDLAHEQLADLDTAPAARFEICDIGLRSQNWETLTQQPTDPRPEDHPAGGGDRN